MVIHRLHTHTAHYPIEELRRGALEERVALPIAAHTVHYIAACLTAVNHLWHHIDVVLQVGIYAQYDVTVGYGVLKPCHESLLVAHIGRKFRQTVERLLYNLLFVVAGNNYRQLFHGLLYIVGSNL